MRMHCRLGGVFRWSVPATIVSLMLATGPVGGQETTPKPSAGAAKSPAGPLPANPFPRRIKAPPLDGAVAWLNVAAPLELEQLRGKFVILDFWTYCCINCMHILPELKKLEHAYPNELVVIGVHSAKFDEEKDAKNIQEAILRYEIEHPVANDAEHAIWNRYGVQSWPTLLMIDPEGEVVFANSGETTFEQLDPVMKKAIAYYKAKGTLDETPIRFDLEAQKAKATPLRFPGKVLADAANNRLFIADSNHNRIVITSLDGKLLDIVGDGTIGRNDGDFKTSSFNHPQGMALLKDAKLDVLYVCDTENHMLRKIDLAGKSVKTIAGTGVQARGPWPGMSLSDFKLGNLPTRFVGRPHATALNSPWDLVIHGKDLFIAMAGPHQIWKMPLDEAEIGPYAGNGREDIVDGALLPNIPYAEGFSSFAQPSGLASDGLGMYVADSEGASIRWVPFDPTAKVVTIVGTSRLPQGRLFYFGDVDGVGDEVRLQHPLGVAFHDGVCYVADTYNNKIKAIQVKQSAVTTIAGNGEPGLADEPAQFDEPAGLSYAGGKLYVADTNNHAIRVVDLSGGSKTTTLRIDGLEPPTKPQATPVPQTQGAKEVPVERQSLKPTGGAVKLAVQIKLPAGFKLNPLAPMSYRIEVAAGSTGPVDRSKLGQAVRIEPAATTFEVPVPVTAETGEDQVRIALNYYYCREGKEGVCKMGRVVWAVPLTLAGDGKAAAALEIAPE
jgi:thiol-disulfide isomerase/thioredoxin